MKIDTYRTNPKLRLSWSLYNMWSRNDYDGMESYLKCEKIEPTEAMERGRLLHERAESEITSEIIKKELGLSGEWKFEFEKRFKVDFSEHSVLTGLYDVIGTYDDRVVIVDYKTGKTSGYEKQLELYTFGFVIHKCKKSTLFQGFYDNVMGEIDNVECYLIGLDDDLNWTCKELIYPDISWCFQGLIELESFCLDNF